VTEQLKLLMDYTIFHIGLYATLCTLLIAILGVGPWKEHSAHMSYYLLRACLKSPHPSPTAAFRIRQPPFNPRTGDDPICLGFSDACQAQAGGVRTEAGVRKASREETAGRQGHDGTARRSYGDLRAAGDWLRCGRRDCQMGLGAG